MVAIGGDSGGSGGSGSGRNGSRDGGGGSGGDGCTAAVKQHEMQAVVRQSLPKVVTKQNVAISVQDSAIPSNRKTE